MISSAVDELSSEQVANVADADAGAIEAGVSESTGLSQQLNDQGLVEVPDSYAGAQQLTPHTSTQTAQISSKKKKKSDT